MLKTGEEKQATVDVNKASIWARISIGFGIIGALYILNFFLAIIPNNLQGEQIVRAFVMGFIGIVFGLIDLIRYSDKTSFYGVVWNLLLLVFPFAYWYLGTLIFGP